MQPFLSVIVPYYNSPIELAKLLVSLKRSEDPPTFEIIIVDDASSLKHKISNYKSQLKFKLITLVKNRGPAAARNRGAEVARGKFLLFLDCDVEVFPDTLKNLGKIFRDDPDIVAVTGVWVKKQRSKSFFPNFKALRDWSYWINERDKHGYYYLFSTRIASIKRSVFQRLGGFDESYTAALVEDIEFTYRIARRYAIIFAPNVRVRHEFSGFWPVAKKYFWRSFYWIRLFGRRKRFDPVATTEKEALAALSGVGVIVLGPLILLGYLELVWLAILIIHLILVRKFLGFMWQERGMIFMLKGFFVGLILYCFIVAGAAVAFCLRGIHTKVAHEKRRS